jgi:hypothetical protein
MKIQEEWSYNELMASNKNSQDESKEVRGGRRLSKKSSANCISNPSLKE